MKIIEVDLQKEIIIDDEIIACIGYFDGLHKGHQNLIDKVFNLAKAKNTKKALISFDIDPLSVILNKRIRNIQSLDTRIKMLESMNFDYFIILKFNEVMMNLSHQEFHARILDKLNIKELVLGFDFHYGKNALGDKDTLTSAGYKIHVIDEITYANKKISSTRIKMELENGNIDLVNKLLGYNYFISSKVIEGNKLGRSIKFPTINLEIDHDIIKLQNAVYFGYAIYHNKKYDAMINIGTNPTIDDGKEIKIEAHLLGFNDEIYGSMVDLYFLKKHRDEIKFNSLNELKIQLNKDLLALKEFIEN